MSSRILIKSQGNSQSTSGFRTLSLRDRQSTVAQNKSIIDLRKQVDVNSRSNCRSKRELRCRIQKILRAVHTNCESNCRRHKKQQMYMRQKLFLDINAVRKKRGLDLIKDPILLDVNKNYDEEGNEIFTPSNKKKKSDIPLTPMTALKQKLNESEFEEIQEDINYYIPNSHQRQEISKKLDFWTWDELLGTEDKPKQYSPRVSIQAFSFDNVRPKIQRKPNLQRSVNSPKREYKLQLSGSSTRRQSDYKSNKLDSIKIIEKNRERLNQQLSKAEENLEKQKKLQLERSKSLIIKNAARKQSVNQRVNTQKSMLQAVSNVNALTRIASQKHASSVRLKEQRRSLAGIKGHLKEWNQKVAYIAHKNARDDDYRYRQAEEYRSQSSQPESQALTRWASAKTFK